MSFRKPEEDDEGQTFEEGSTGGGSGSITEATVQFGGEEVTVADALRLTGDALANPDVDGGVADADRVAALEKKIAELRGENTELRKANNDLRSELETLRGDMAALWEAVGKKDKKGRYVVEGDGTGYGPESFDAADPVGDADE